MYEITYKKELSNSDYTQHKVYHIKSDVDDFHKAKREIAALMEKEYTIWSSGLYYAKNRNEPSMSNALHPYYTFSYNEDLDVYVYTLVFPYDD
jgi:hypothetical protein